MGLGVPLALEPPLRKARHHPPGPNLLANKLLGEGGGLSIEGTLLGRRQSWDIKTRSRPCPRPPAPKEQKHHPGAPAVSSCWLARLSTSSAPFRRRKGAQWTTQLTEKTAGPAPPPPPEEKSKHGGGGGGNNMLSRRMSTSRSTGSDWDMEKQRSLCPCVLWVVYPILPSPASVLGWRKPLREMAPCFSGMEKRKKLEPGRAVSQSSVTRNFTFGKLAHSACEVASCRELSRAAGKKRLVTNQ